MMMITAAAEILGLPLGARAEAAAAGLVGVDDRLAVVDDDATGREIRTRNELLHQRLDRRIRMLDQMQRRVAQFMRVVRRNRGRHADGDARRAVSEKVRESARKNRRLLVFLVIGQPEIDGVLVDAFEQQPGDIGHAGFGVSIGSRTVAIDVAEVPLPVDDGITLREILGETDQRIVDRLVAVRVELTDDVTDDTGAFLEGRVWANAHLAHRVDNAAMDRLQAVANVGQRAVHDGRQRVGEITLFERRLQVDRKNAVIVSARRRQNLLSHTF